MPRKARPPWLETIGNVYYAHWYDPTAKRVKRRSLGTGDSATAQIAFAAFLIEGQRIAVETAGAGLTVGAALDYYYNEHVTKKRGDGTFVVIDQKRIRALIVNLKSHFESLPVEAVNQASVDAYLTKRRTGAIQIRTRRRAGDGTLLRELSCLRTAIKHNVENHRIRLEHVHRFDLPQAPPPKERWLTLAEAQALLAAASVPGARRISRLYRFLMIALYTGARKSAIQNLMWTQIDFKTGFIAFNRPGARQSKKRKPTVPMSTELRGMLERAFAEKQSLYVLDSPGETRTAFRNALRRARMSGSGVSRHTLRHTFATWALQRGVSPWKVAGMLGDTFQTVMRTYAHHIPHHLTDAVDFTIYGDASEVKSEGSS